MALLEGLRAAAMEVLKQFVGGLALLLFTASVVAVYGPALGVYTW